MPTTRACLFCGKVADLTMESDIGQVFNVCRTCFGYGQKKHEIKDSKGTTYYYINTNSKDINKSI